MPAHSLDYIGAAMIVVAVFTIGLEDHFKYMKPRVYFDVIKKHLNFQ